MVYSEAQRTDNFKMMKKIAIIACTACCGITAVQPQAGAEVAEAAVLPADEAELMVNEVIAILKEMATILESVQDKDSADAAAKQLEALEDRMEQCRHKLQEMPKLDKPTRDKLHQQLMTAVFLLAPRIQSAVARIKKNEYYGSAELRNIAHEL